MNLVNRIQFPDTPETSGLYMKCNEDASLTFCPENPEVALTKNGVLSLNTYFNSFYEKFYAKYTELSSLYYLLKLEGNFQVSVYREQYGRENRECIHTKSFENCKTSEPVKIPLLDSWRSEEAGRVYLEITCLNELGLFAGGFIATEEPKIREVSLGIITCTFKKEAYVKNTVSKILKDDCLQEKKFKVFVVDNGRTLKQDEFDDPRVQLIPNRNVGGTGGFTRGLIQALQEGVHTHFLFMDDDIELEPESIYRLFPLYEYANQDFTVAGSMLDLYKKHMSFEAGALYYKRFDTQGNVESYPFILTPLNNNLDLRKPTSLNLFLREYNADYGAFWFFSFSKVVVEKIGLPLPFFIKLDDTEFGLRVKKHFGNAIVAFPSIAVWHEPFYTKKTIWDYYYLVRNQLITGVLYDSIKYLDVVKKLSKTFIDNLLLFDYNSAQLIIKGFEDYMKGPNFIKSNDPEIIHFNICKDSKSYNTQTILSDKYEVYSNNSSAFLKPSKFQQIVSLLTLNGHFLPNFIIKDDIAIIRTTPEDRDSRCLAFCKKKVVCIMDKNPSCFQNEIDNSTGIKLLIRWLKSIIISSWKWAGVSAEWKNAEKDLTSIKFWQDYLKPNK